jgi:hypothetical protein
MNPLERPTIHTGQSPTVDRLEQTLEHLTGRRADPQEVSNLMQRLQVKQGDYAPGGEVGIPGSNRPIR